MNAYETMGFIYVVLAVGLFSAGLFGFAAYGVKTMKRQWKRGAEGEEADLRISSSVREAAGK